MGRCLHIPERSEVAEPGPFHVDVVAGGFPCQDVSVAGRGAGISGSRSGLWRQMVRCVRVVRPLYVVVENVAALLRRGMGRVLGDLAASGYDAEWDCLPAGAFGAHFLRERVFVVARRAGARCVRWQRRGAAALGTNQ